MYILEVLHSKAVLQSGHFEGCPTILLIQVNYLTRFNSQLINNRFQVKQGMYTLKKAVQCTVYELYIQNVGWHKGYSANRNGLFKLSA